MGACQTRASLVYHFYMPKHPLTLCFPVLILIIAALATWYVLDRETSPREIGEPDTRVVGYIKESEPYYEIDAAYPTATPLRPSAGITADSEAVATIEAFLKADIESFKEDSGILSLTEEDATFLGLSDTRTYVYGAEYRQYTAKNTVSYLYSIYVDTLGAHPNGYHRSFTFDMNTGELLSLSSLFEGDAYLEQLSAISQTELPRIIAEKTGGLPNEVNLDMLLSGTEPTEENFSTFYLTDTDLVIVFSPYQVGPWAIGTQMLPVPLSELTDLKSAYR